MFRIFGSFIIPERVSNESLGRRIHRFRFPKNSQFSYQTNECFLRNRMITLCAVDRFTFCLAEINFLIIKLLELRDLSLFLHSRLLDLHSFAQENVQIVRYENEKGRGSIGHSDTL